MTLPIFIQQSGNEFTASLLGSSELRCVRASRDEAIDALRCELTKRLANQEWVELDLKGIAALAGRLLPTLISNRSASKSTGNVLNSATHDF